MERDIVEDWEQRVTALLEELHAFGDLGPGWDGETAEPASWPSIRDATRLVNAAGRLAASLEATLHVDGTVILQAPTGTLAFPGDGSVVHAFEGAEPGTVDFDAANLPPRVRLHLMASRDR